MECTPEKITDLFPNEVFVYGSNQFAIHGAGSARMAAQRFGAIYENCPMGLCGQSYGIITQSFNKIPVEIEFIHSQVLSFYYFAQLRPDLIFYMTKIGCGLAGFNIEEIAAIFKEMPKLKNVILPKEFSH